MLKIVSDYLNDACKGIRNEKRQQAVRAELAGHFADSMDALMQKGFSEEDAAKAACTQMGDVREVSRKLAQANKPTQSIVFVGYAMVFLTLLFSIFLLTDSVEPLIDIFSLFIVLFFTAGFTLIGGVRGATFAVVCKRVSVAALYAGGIDFLIETIIALTFAKAENIQICLAVCLISPLYGLIISGLAHGVSAMQSRDAREVLGLREAARDRPEVKA